MALAGDSTSRASAPSSSARFDSSTAWRVEGAPVPARTGHLAVHRGAHGDQQVAALVGVERGRLSGGAGDEHGPHAGVDQPGGVVGGGRGVDLALVVEQRHEGDADAFEDRAVA